jgi:hypothetical protein
LEEAAISLLESCGQLTEFLVEDFLVEDIGDADTAPGGLGGVCRTDTLACGANVALAQLDLF